MPVQKPAYQLSLDLDVEVPEEGGISEQEAALLREGARQAFEARGEKPEWYGEYEALLRGGWPFRVAMYIAWASSPRKGRWPESIGELAALMGLKSPRAIYTWRGKNPAIDQQVALMQAAPLFQHRADLFRAALEVALQPDYKGHQDRKMLFEMLGDYERVSQVRAQLQRGAGKDLSELSEDDLRALAGELDELLGDENDDGDDGA